MGLTSMVTVTVSCESRMGMGITPSAGKGNAISWTSISSGIKACMSGSGSKRGRSISVFQLQGLCFCCVTVTVTISPSSFPRDSLLYVDIFSCKNNRTTQTFYTKANPPEMFTGLRIRVVRTGKGLKDLITCDTGKISDTLRHMKSH